MGKTISEHVYVVDDEPLVRSSICAILKGHGYTPSDFSSADELLGVLDELERGCILSDVRMPGMSPNRSSSEVDKLAS